MIKTYRANTNVSINVVLQSKKNLHITFTPLSNGSSTFTTDNEEIMNAIESHYKFGTLFRLHSVHGESKKKDDHDNTDAFVDGDENEQSGEGISSDGEDIPSEDEESDVATGLKQVTVSDLSSAKDYLADKFGISRTALRSKKAIVDQASANGIEFVGLS